MRNTLPLLAAFFCLAGNAAAQSYKCTVSGRVEFSDKPCAQSLERKPPVGPSAVSGDRKMTAAEIQADFDREVAKERKKKQDEEERNAQEAAQRKQTERKDAEAKAACEQLLKSEPRFYINPRTGGIPHIEAQIRQTMRDPDSFRVEKWLTERSCEDEYTTFVTYRARNGFGGMNAGMLRIVLDKNGSVKEYKDLGQ